MSTVVYREVLPLQSNCSYYDQSYVAEPLTLSLKLTNSNNISTTTTTTATTTKGWGAIEFLPSSSTATDEAAVYVHPLSKRSSMLSDKSLEMCTESLGNETGTCMSIDSSLFLSKPTTTKPTQKVQTTNINSTNNKAMDNSSSTSSNKFPPPLTTLSGSNSILVRPYREEGRLVIEAVSAPPTQCCLQVERSDGRLRLSMIRDCVESMFDNEAAQCEDNNVESVNEVEECVTNGVEEEEEEEQQQKEVVEVEAMKREGKKGSASGVQIGEDMSGITIEFGVKMGMGEFHQRPRRCKEGGRGNNRLINWEAFWVAT